MPTTNMARNNDDEPVWVVPAAQARNRIHRGGRFQELEPGVYWTAPGDARVSPHELPCMGELFMTRSAAEANGDFLQPIPYVVMVQGGRLVRYRRLPKVGEGRLVGRTSIGVGGHLSIYPAGWNKTVEEALAIEAWREVNEELALTVEPVDDFSPCDFPDLTGVDPEFCGYLLDRRDAVGRVHLGLVHVLRLPDDVRVDVHPDERHKLRIETALAPGDTDTDLEGWSRLILAHALVPAAPPNQTLSTKHVRRARSPADADPIF